MATVDVVIHAGRDQHHIVLCLASLLRQTRRPRRFVLVDDGGEARDHTVQLAREFARANDLQLEVVVRELSLGKAVTIKRQSREFDGDVVFVLDADTVLDSPDYIECCVRELHQGVGISSACGSVRPLLPAHREALAGTGSFQRWLAGDRYFDPQYRAEPVRRLWRWLGDHYGECVAQIEQGLIQPGLMDRYGGTASPLGKAVAYRRSYLKNLFDRYEPIRGDDLSECEDLFIGPALNNEGYRNVQLAEVVARVHYPSLQHLPRCAHRWSASFLQGGHCFDALLRTPLRRRRRSAEGSDTSGADMRRIREAYRQPFGERLTALHGRPIGTALLLGAFERIGYPAVLGVLLLLGQWPALALLVGGETTLAMMVLARLAPPGERASAAVRGLLATPLRYLLIFAELFTMLRFATQLWLTGKRRWFAHRQAPRFADHQGTRA
ncbi:MAG: glycosyltransferase family 2 protein [Pseudomonadota bacterium]|nr:glycosyltransferase family 2 protein [Pseudomonadota bacterium]